VGSVCAFLVIFRSSSPNVRQSVAVVVACSFVCHPEAEGSASAVAYSDRVPNWNQDQLAQKPVKPQIHKTRASPAQSRDAVVISTSLYRIQGIEKAPTRTIFHNPASKEEFVYNPSGIRDLGRDPRRKLLIRLMYACSHPAAYSPPMNPFPSGQTSQQTNDSPQSHRNALN
jgi:hypothetical protein